MATTSNSVSESMGTVGSPPLEGRDSVNESSVTMGSPPPIGRDSVIESNEVMGYPPLKGLDSVTESNCMMGSPPPSKDHDSAGESNGMTSSQPLKGRVAIVTGGSGGIGGEISHHLASLGAKVVISYIGELAPAEQLVSTINSESGDSKAHPQAIAVESNVSDPAQVKALFDKAQSTFGPQIHILVATAGVQDPKYPALAETSLESWEWVFNVNAKGTFLCCREAANRLVRGGGGRIITMSSSTVGSLRPGYSTYSSSKAAVETMTRILAKELKGTGITSNGVAPGPIVTPMFYSGKSEERIRAVAAESPMGRLGEPKDVAPLVGFLASDAGEWVNGQIIRVNGGYI